MKLQKEMRQSFRHIANNPMDLNRLMEFIANMSNAVDILTTEAIGTDAIFNLHMDMLGTPPDGFIYPQVSHVDQWRALGATVKPGSQIDLSKVPSEKLFFWSDTHHGHKKVIEYTGRPFTDLNHMHEQLIQNYNSIVGPSDIVVWIGDISFASTNNANEWLKRFNGYKILVVGNHDIDHGKLKQLDFDEIHTSITFDDFIVTHHPWYNMLPEGFRNIHGHMHNRPFNFENHYCACVELIDYKPINLNDLLYRNPKSFPNYGTALGGRSYG